MHMHMYVYALVCDPDTTQSGHRVHCVSIVQVAENPYFEKPQKKKRTLSYVLPTPAHSGLYKAEVDLLLVGNCLPAQG